ncbi:hypothetical protein PoB_002495100 [Plakobranchus ocellatus]|uniref:Ubiquitin-like domain-containing protein n=1 Tax=Plakobranchus ocellatus TaxID=259542 RepID=A0AAV3ZR50_9GAST|nr:hypothetical protein PoB_002495100 [Plakobranchus ocellatus]
MGTAASKGSVGVPVNPRVNYSQSLGKKEQKQVLVDAPVLVDVEHGSVRYRQPETERSQKMKGKEIPYENEKSATLSNKEHYFYHARLKEYGPDISKQNEDAFKLYYVLKGPASSKQKKLFYVYGQGWEAKDGLRLKPTETVGQGKDYAWSSTHRPNALYYRLDFDTHDLQAMMKTEEDQLMSDLEPTPDKSKIKLYVSPEERAKDIKARLAIRLLKSPTDIHIAFENKELRDEDVVMDLSAQKEGSKVHESTETSESCAVILTLLV